MTADRQRQNVRLAAPALAAVAAQHQLVLSHGNGPQVGLLALQAAAYTDVEPYPLDVLGAETEGMIGYVLEQELGNVMPKAAPLASLLTMIEVDPGDPGFGNPTKFVGPVYTKDQADALEAAVDAALTDSQTPDLGGTATTREVGDAVLRHLEPA